MVAMGPTLGQAIIFLVLQILGAVLGSVWGLAVLEVCRYSHVILPRSDRLVYE